MTAPGLSFLDSGELVAAARELGGVHPPGHPGWLSLAGLAEWLPLGAYAGRVAWLSSLFAGASVFVAARIGRRLAGGQTTAQRRLGTAGAWTAGLGLAGAGSLWLVANRAEVYTLALATNLWALDAALRAGDRASDRAAGGQQGTADPRPLWGAMAEVVAAVALGLLNHHYVTLFALPAVVAAGLPALLGAGRAGGRVLVGLVALGACFGLAYLAVPWRAGHLVEMRWGDPTTLAGFIDTVTAQHFQRSVSAFAGSRFEQALALVGAAGVAVGPIVAMLGGLGLVLGLFRRRRATAALWLAFAGAVATKALMQIDLFNPDDHGYILLAPAALALGVALAIDGVLGEGGLLAALPANGRQRVGVGALALLVGAGFGAQALAHTADDDINLHALRGPDRVDALIRRALPAGALYLPAYYGLAFNEQAFRIAEGRRPDLVVAHQTFRTSDTDGGRAFGSWFAQRYPECAELGIGAVKLGRPPTGNVLEIAEQHPVFAGLDAASRIPIGYYGFHGLTHRLLTEPERRLDYNPAAERARQEALTDRMYELLGEDALRHRETRGLLLWHHALQVVRALKRGWMVLARSELERAKALKPEDRLLGRLEARVTALEDAWSQRDADAFKALWRGYSAMDFDALTSTQPPPSPPPVPSRRPQP